jgi:Ca2+-binding RTX toxin-like protein
VIGDTTGCGFVLIGNDVEDDPLLGPLRDNGGPTETHAIGAGSPALDRHDDDTLCGGTDQRGVPRPTGEDCDSGSYERVLCGVLPVDIVGTTGADAIAGTPNADSVLGLGGNDSISGGDGDDQLCGGDGRDRLSGGSGADRLDGGAQKDKCVGGPNKDRFVSCEKRKQ